jgi:hypothetical protein
MNTKPDLWAFLVEIFTRLGSKSPKFFVWLQWVFMILAFITGLPEVLSMVEIDAPAWLTLLSSKTVAISSLLGLIVSKMPMQGQTISSGKDLPFTSKKEGNAANFYNQKK